MQDDDKTPPDASDPDKTPSTHDQINRPGMTNGIPDGTHDGQAKGAPHDDRQQTEKAAGDAEAQTGSGSGS